MANRLYAFKNSHINLDHISVISRVREADSEDHIESGYCFSVELAGIDTEFVASFDTEEDANKARNALVAAVGEYVPR